MGGVATQTRRLISDSAGNVHLFFTTSPGGTQQLLHNFRTPTGSWSTSRIVSTASTQPVTVVPQTFAQDNKQGTLHCIFQQVGGGSTFQQIFHTTLSTSNPATNWSTPFNVSQAVQDHTYQAISEPLRTLRLQLAEAQLARVARGTSALQILHSLLDAVEA